MSWITSQDYFINVGWFGVVACLSIATVSFLRSDTSGSRRSDGAYQEGTASQIYAEVDEHELEVMRAEYSCFGRFLHHALEELADDVQEFFLIAQILRENKGLLTLLLCGIISMMCALVAGLGSIDFVHALLLSTALYAVTTLLVARAARRIVLQNSEDVKPKLTKTDVQKLMNKIPNEEYIPDTDLGTTPRTTLNTMLSHRGQKCIDDSSVMNKEDALRKLRQSTRRSHDCVICMSSFQRGESIRILPVCHHEFHQTCIDQWAGTFVSGNTRKTEDPTCPLCNASCFSKEDLVRYLIESLRQ